MEEKDILLDYENEILGTKVYYFICSECEERTVFEEIPSQLSCECGREIRIKPPTDEFGVEFTLTSTSEHWTKISVSMKEFNDSNGGWIKPFCNPCAEIKLEE